MAERFVTKIILLLISMLVFGDNKCFQVIDFP